MELKEIEQIWNHCYGTDEYFPEETFKTFCSLCDKAKYILWEEITKPKSYFLFACGLDEDLIKMSPIEQIMYIAFKIFEFNFCAEFPISFDLTNQYEISYRSKKYKADFLISSMIMNGIEYRCEKPIIIECDGYDSHHTKEQRNYDIERENNLKTRGYSIMRFTGSQIFKNPYDCVMRTYKFLLDENQSVIKQAREDMIKEQEHIEKWQKEKQNAQAND